MGVRMLTGIDIHSYISEIELCHGVVNAFEVCVVCICTFGHVQVGD